MADVGSKIRLKQLDILRSIAVIMVLIYHFTPYYQAPAGPLGFYVRLFFSIFGRIGWSGVDLFFVLSGFLVSGLLFKEYQRLGSINALRFLVRRGLKIYPQFYVFLALTTLIFTISGIHHRDPINLPALSSELFFLQNYVTPVWGHTWSLAIEEHFYLFLSILVFLLTPSKQRGGGGHGIRYIQIICVGVFFLCLIARFVTYQHYAYNCRTHLFPTHLRIDSLMFGVFLSYLYYFKQELLRFIVKKYNYIIMFMSLLLLSVMFCWPVGSIEMGIFGLTAIYVGYGGLLLLFIFHPVEFSGIRGILYNTVSYIGRYSYAIYLWHIFVREVTQQVAPGFLNYLTGSLIIGVITTHLIELPVLKFRETFLPTHINKTDDLVSQLLPVYNDCTADSPVVADV